MATDLSNTTITESKKKRNTVYFALFGVVYILGALGIMEVMKSASQSSQAEIDAPALKSCEDAGGRTIYTGHPGNLKPLRDADGKVACFDQD